MASSLAQNAIALLIDLAERGELDPWDVDVIDVIDRFLSKLKPAPVANGGRSPYEADLSESGQAFLYASMLLLLKADSLARLEVQDQPQDDFFEGDFIFADDFIDQPLPTNLEQKIRRRAVSPPLQNRRVTLQDLISQLNLIADAMEEPRSRRIKSRRPRPQSRSQAIKAISELAHQENLSEIAAILEQFLANYWEDISQQEDWMDFEILLELWATQAQIDEDSKVKSESKKRNQKASEAETTAANPEGHASVHDRVGIFWALLYLSAQNKVELAQEVFYDDLRVRSFLDEVGEGGEVGEDGEGGG
jgi:segregation and condensation protein A